ncbi:hypothetical protein TCE0_041r14101 [Talaromyces pinophilus]|uniref:Major facilitator superfamily (MFS) profile domain-containing protein n=1 Tax=Talaromyces pinophilus TaxID=128442 RepID=A0A6V8HK22_TALPI|nr:hypothetical protein DPV78_012333 [Talaromyces pinophilus]GAM41174.1 hypothetical protein TCE0_041r14101 [Talaromyces pinophilus]
MEIKKVEPLQTTVRDIESGALKNVKPKDADLALKVYELDVTEAEMGAVNHRKLVRKIDLRLIPIMMAAITLFTMDKATLSYSSIMGIQHDAHLTPNEYSWLGSIFSLGYMFANFPCALIIQKVPLSKWVVITMSIWGVLLASMAAGKNYGSLFAIRLLLGIFEASITPVFVIMTGMWYTRAEQAARLGLWYSGVGLATIIGSPIAWALDSPSASTGSLSSWQLLYVVFGAITIALAICFYFIVPDSQLSAKFLTPAERVVAVNRIRVNQQGIGNRKFKAYQAIEVLKDPRTYLYFAFQFIANIGYGAVGTFGSLMLVSLGFESRKALIMTMPHGATTWAGVVVICYFASKMNDRTLWAGVSALFGIVFGACLYGLDNNKWGSVIAFYFQQVFVAAYILNFSLVSANTAGHTKKVLTNCILLLGSTSGSMTGPQITKNASVFGLNNTIIFAHEFIQDPTYEKVKLMMMLAPTICLLILACIRLINIFENRRRDKLQMRDEHLANSEFLDLTDGENKEFRYQM